MLAHAPDTSEPNENDAGVLIVREDQMVKLQRQHILSLAAQFAVLHSSKQAIEAELRSLPKELAACMTAQTHAAIATSYAAAQAQLQELKSAPPSSKAQDQPDFKGMIEKEKTWLAQSVDRWLSVRRQIAHLNSGSAA